MGKVAQQMEMRAAESDDFDFALDSPTAVVRPQQRGGGGSSARPDQAPEAQIQRNKAIAQGDPAVAECVETIIDYMVGAGFEIHPANIPGTDDEQTDEDIANLKSLVEQSDFETTMYEWVRRAVVDGTGFLEIVVEEDQFKPKVLPTEDMELLPNEFGDITQIIMRPGGGDEITFDPGDIAILTFKKDPAETFGRSLVEPAQEQADMLRDMEIDFARFVATKAYPPIVWKLGSEERQYSESEIQGWLDTLEDIEPESQLAVGHDVDHDVVGTTSTSSSSGALNLDPYFEHLQKRIATAFGMPDAFINVGSGSAKNETLAKVPKFSRRIQRFRQEIRQVVRYQIFASIEIGDGDIAEYDGLPPEFEFNKHSSEEERLDADTAIKLFNNGLLNRRAAAERLGIDPETELPADAELEEQIDIIQRLAGSGDEIQNPDGGAPSNTGGGAQSAGREAKSRDNPEKDNTGDTDRPRQAQTEQ